MRPHGPAGRLEPRLVGGDERSQLQSRARSLRQVPLSSREVSDLIMLGVGAFTPLPGFMGHDDWRSVCDGMTTAGGTFWPVPITCSASEALASDISIGEEVALVEDQAVMGTMLVEEIYEVDKRYECRSVFGTDDPVHPGAAKVMAQGDKNLAGPVTVLSEGSFPELYPQIYLRPEETRKMFADAGWKKVAAFQTRNPMHRSHEYLAKLAVEALDGVFVHQVLGRLKEGDIPAEVRVRAVDALIGSYFVEGTCLQGGYPMEMRYGGPREALLHAVLRQNFGCSHLIVGRDHAGVGSYYGPYDAQDIFDELPPGSLEIQPFKVTASFYCYRCDGMASERTCPHGPSDRLSISGTKLRQMLTDGEPVPGELSRPEVLAILRAYYSAS